MAEELEKAQKALRDMDYDSMSEDGEADDADLAASHAKPTSQSLKANSKATNIAAHLPSPEVSSVLASSLENFLSSTDDPKEDISGNNGVGVDRTATNGTGQTKPQNNNFGIGGGTSRQASTQPMTAIPSNTQTRIKGGATSMAMATPRGEVKNNGFNGIPAPNSLFDDDDSSTASFNVELQTFRSNSDEDDDGVRNFDIIDASSNARASVYPGTAGYLEMEEEPPRAYLDHTNSKNTVANENNYNSTTSTEMENEPIKTDSGLVLTHRKTPATATYRNQNQQQQQQQGQHNQNVFRDTQQNYFEVENGVLHGRNKGNPNFGHRHNGEGTDYFGGYNGGKLGGAGNGKHSMILLQAKRLMSYVKIWVVLFLCGLVAMTGVFLHSMGHQEDPETTVIKTDASLSQSSSMNTNTNVNGNVLLPDAAPESILLLPLQDASELSSPFLQQQWQQQLTQQQPQLLPHNVRRLKSLQDSAAPNGSNNSASSHHLLGDLRREFDDWIRHHGKTYKSEKDREQRFSIWSQNHHRTAEKNKRHGPCTLTKQHVFGSNQFKDLAPEEFQKKFLTGYKGEYTDVLEQKQQEWSPSTRRLRKEAGIGFLLNPKTHEVKIHESVVGKQRHLQQLNSRYKPQVMGGTSMYCKWYDLSCVLRFIWQSTGIQFGNLVGTMEPKYDADAFPNSVDWRDSGAVTDVRTQGECGACWAVTAVETVESAYFLSTGNLYELSESEIIVCDDSCEMCSGGWPQNAYEWVMDHGGLPLRSKLPYDAYTLIALTEGLQGESEYFDESSVESYRASVCPASDDSHSGSGSNDNSYWEDGMDNENYADYSDQGRYGNIRGYGYATDRCLCYTDGSGCDCEDQDEDTAVRNIATYGPAVVCLEASTWQDYSGGIMTTEIGCGQEFMDMNHCIQVVGYAFTTTSYCSGDEGEGCGGSNDEGSGSASGSNSRSGDSGGREGYWIVRNQWGDSWGMNGYAYVSMGDNTCGILNDMTIAYA